MVTTQCVCLSVANKLLSEHVYHMYHGIGLIQEKDVIVAWQHDMQLFQLKISNSKQLLNVLWYMVQKSTGDDVKCAFAEST